MDPGLARRLSAQLPLGAILVTGTNGKTTTSRMIASVLECAGLAALHNREGSNMMRGVVTTLLARSTMSGRLRVSPDTIGLFEVDEAVLPLALAALPARLVLVTNLFRDQLDRYGEVDSIAALWGRALATLGPETTVVLNSDDPQVAGLGSVLRAPVCYFGVQDGGLALPGLEHAADAKWCPCCGRDYDYSLAFCGHLGHYHCPGCGATRPKPDVALVGTQRHGAGADIEVRLPDGAVRARVPLPGSFNLYNALAAAAACHALGLPPEAVVSGLEGVAAAFGRAERMEIEGRELCLLLAKNPVGLNEIVRALTDEPDLRALFALNDQIADGRDVSWIWDADLEPLAGRVAWAGATGIRAEEMALRLKYAGLGDGLTVERDIRLALRQAVESTPEGGRLHVVCTYTAMLLAREHLARLAGRAHYWQEERA